MRAIIWKELRENLKWAVLAMIGLGVAEFYGLFYVDSQTQYSESGLPLCKATFLMATSFGCALVGFLLGFLQILPEQRRDQWAALIHRPVSRAIIFRGKVGAGVLLYLLATTVPFMGCVWFTATPGHFEAPFLPPMILPGLADLLVGLVFYFAALTAALQRGSWFGARTMALFAAVYASFASGRSQYFYLSVETVVLMGSALFFAASGAMLSNGSWKDRPWISRAALVVVVFYGIWGMLGLVTTVSRAGNEAYNPVGSEYRFTLEGQPLIVTTRPDLSVHVTDLAGHVITDERYQGRQSYETMLNPWTISTYIGDPHGFDNYSFWENYRQGRLYAGRLYNFQPSPVSWFYLTKQRYYVGISHQTKRPILIADKSGFRPWGSVPDPFGPEMNMGSGSLDLTTISEGDALYVYDFIHEKMLHLQSPGNQPIYATGRVVRYLNPPAANEIRLIIALDHELVVYDREGHLLTTLPYQQDVAQWGMIGLALGPALDRYYITYAPSIWHSWAQRQSMPTYFQELNNKGEVIYNYELPPLPYVPHPPGWVSILTEKIQSPVIWYGAVLIQKIKTSLGMKVPNNFSYYSPRKSHAAKVGIQITLISLALSLATVAWARRNQFSWSATWAWAVFVLATNLAGLITFRLAADWPVRVKCPECSRKRQVEAEQCPHCQAAWPAPTPNGLEIFEEKIPAAQTVS